MFSYPVESFQVFINLTIILSQRLLLLSTIVTLISIALYMNGTQSQPPVTPPTNHQNKNPLSKSADSKTHLEDPQNEWCYSSEDVAAPSIVSRWNLGP